MDEEWTISSVGDDLTYKKLKVLPDPLVSKYITSQWSNDKTEVDKMIDSVMTDIVESQGLSVKVAPDLVYGIPEYFFNAKIKKAREFAEIVHSGQTYGDQPYIKHLIDAYRVFLEFVIEPIYGKVHESYTGGTITANGHVNVIDQYENIACAILLHDTIEDTGTSRDEIANIFGDDVADMVDAVSGVGANRKEKLQSIIRKVEERPDAIVVKLCDRIANTRASEDEFRAGKSTLFLMYCKELPSLKAALGGVYSEIAFVKRMWEYLESISRE